MTILLTIYVIVILIIWWNLIDTHERYNFTNTKIYTAFFWPAVIMYAIVVLVKTVYCDYKEKK